MSATQRYTYDQRTVLWDISDGEVLQVILQRRNNEPWAFFRADIHRVVLRKGDRADESFWSLDTLPQWARPLVEESLRSVEATR